MKAALLPAISLILLIGITSCAAPTKTPIVPVRPPAEEVEALGVGEAQRVEEDFFRQMPLDASRPRHVHFMHLDGFRSDLFKGLLEMGQLPHFKFLLSRGKVSYKASTVDKSETMKVIESYLTSRRDTATVGWWQWNRENYQFKNYWLDPAEVVNYALGLEFPLYPNVYDFLAFKKQNLVTGISLHRRSVEFDHYSRAYLEGAEAVYNHTYYDQVHATMNSFRNVLKKAVKNGEQVPTFTTSLLAAADEFCQLDGVRKNEKLDKFSHGNQFCIKRGEDPRAEIVFKAIEQDDKDQGKHDIVGHFASVKRQKYTDMPVSICFRVPRLQMHADPSRQPGSDHGSTIEELAAPRYALGMIMIDIQLGYLIDTLRSIHVSSDGRGTFDDRRGNGLKAYIRAKKREGSLFENTLFALMGDHGMVDTRMMMTPVQSTNPDSNRNPHSRDFGFVHYLNTELRLLTPPDKDHDPEPENLLGIDDLAVPPRLAYPHKKVSEWKVSDPTKKKVAARLEVKARTWANAFFKAVVDKIKDEHQRKYFWILIFKSRIFDPKVDKKIAQYKPKVIEALVALYLKGEPAYVAAELEANKNYYDEKVRLVYGGGAQNNAELFIPSMRDGRPDWGKRPTYEEILTYKGNARGQKTLIEALRYDSGTGLIFIRKNNGDIQNSIERAEGKMEIAVLDRFKNEATITVSRDEASGELIYKYRVETGKDPLGYLSVTRDESGKPVELSGTYNEWNDRSIVADHYYHNVVAGMGSFLYSNNPAIGDLTLMHSQGWSYGKSAGGHGGLHKEEKLTLMLFSGPEIAAGELKATSHFRTGEDGQIVQQDWETNPTVVDMAPTVLNWLGHGEKALSDFARSDFPKRLQEWASKQQADVHANANNLDGVEEAMKKAGVNVKLSEFSFWLNRLHQFIPKGAPKLPQFRHFREDGNLLKL